MLFGLATAAMACCSNGNVSMMTNVSGNGDIKVSQQGHLNVAFQNDLKVNTGRLNFNQQISTCYGVFKNSVMLHGKNLQINNMASEQYVAGHWSGTGDGWVRSHREVSFGQDVRMGESSFNHDACKSVQTFSENGKYIKQKVKVCPTANPGNEVEPDSVVMHQSGMMNSKFMKPQFGGRAMLYQNGKMTGDFNLAKQITNLNGGSFSQIKSLNNPNWIHFEQMLMFSK
jgi:hypothetical protein